MSDKKTQMAIALSGLKNRERYEARTKFEREWRESHDRAQMSLQEASGVAAEADPDQEGGAD